MIVSRPELFDEITLGEVPIGEYDCSTIELSYRPASSITQQRAKRSFPPIIFFVSPLTSSTKVLISSSIVFRSRFVGRRCVAWLAIRHFLQNLETHDCCGSHS